MNKRTVNAVEALIYHVINNRLIPRVKKELTETGNGSDSEHYKSLLKYLECFPREEAKATAEKAVSIVRKSFMCIERADIEDLIGIVISSTIQDHDNQYSKVKKSTFGFWEKGYDLKQPVSNFPKAFCHVLYKAVQSQTRNLETLKKHEVICSSMSPEDEDLNFIDTVPDTRSTETTFENMEKFEAAVKTFHDSVMSSDKLDDIDRMMFQVWFDLKNAVDFSLPVRMSSAVYPVLSEKLNEKGISLGHGAMHYRWNRIRKVAFLALS